MIASKKHLVSCVASPNTFRIRAGLAASVWAAGAALCVWAAPAHASTDAKAPTCLHLSQIDHTEVVDDQTILFHMRGKQIWQNKLPYKCPSLGFEKAFSHKTSTNDYCTVDIITVLYTGGGLREGASCGLGNFTAYTPPPKLDPKARVVPMSSGGR